MTSWKVEIIVRTSRIKNRNHIMFCLGSGWPLADRSIKYFQRESEDAHETSEGHER
jgi:hypothetical protein